MTIARGRLAGSEEAVMDWKNEVVLVTGAAGFIGSFLSKRLLERGAVVVGVDNLNDYYDPQLKRDRLALIGGPICAMVCRTSVKRSSIAE